MMYVIHMMRKLSLFSIAAAAGLFLFDAVYYWVFKLHFKVRNVMELWSDISRPGFEKTQAALKAFVPPHAWKSFIHLPAPLLIALLAVLFYAAYRFLFFLSGEKRSARL